MYRGLIMSLSSWKDKIISLTTSINKQYCKSEREINLYMRCAEYSMTQFN